MNPKVLEKYRVRKGLTITELSHRLGHTAGWYSRIKDGERSLPNRYIEPLAREFGIRPERLAKELFFAHQLEQISSESIELES